MNKELFLSAKLENISRVYSGKRSGCRCGCKGDYTDTSFNQRPNGYTDQDDNLVEKRIRRAQKIVTNTLDMNIDVEYGDTYVDIPTGQDRALTFYFDNVENSLIN